MHLLQRQVLITFTQFVKEVWFVFRAKPDFICIRYWWHEQASATSYTNKILLHNLDHRMQCQRQLNKTGLRGLNTILSPETSDIKAQQSINIIYQGKQFGLMNYLNNIFSSRLSTVSQGNDHRAHTTWIWSQRLSRQGHVCNFLGLGILSWPKFTRLGLSYIVITGLSATGIDGHVLSSPSYIRGVRECTFVHLLVGCSGIQALENIIL